ncbi:MAG: hypothetical protein J5918_08165 [Prevotella sp.]|nr:hypothetical protein [Prevotella sp.]
MKNEKEKKNITKSVKVSQNQYDIIMQKASEKHMNFSKYVVDCAVHGNNVITPQIAVKVQEIANTALDLADRLSYEEYDAKDRLYQQSKELNDLFHVDSPLENYAKMIKEIDKIVEGADSLWVYLK